jgi:magnesium transporter
MSRRNRHRKVPKVVRRTQPGAAPGSIVSDPTQPKPTINVIAYGAGDEVEIHVNTPSEAKGLVGRRPVTWIDVEGLGDARTIEQFGEVFGLHRLALEDTVSSHQRAKVESYGEILFIVLRMVFCSEEHGGRAGTEQVSIFVGPNWLISFQEGRPGDCFDRVRARLREGSGKMRTLGSDYLAYALIDAVIDNYYPVLELYALRLDDLEELVLDPAVSRIVMDQLHEVKADLLVLRRALWPLRDAIALLAREDHERITDNTRLFLRDCYDHIVQVVELIETYRELTADLRDLYMSSISNRINETMRVLTIFSTFFIPLTFIVGIYGMNFDMHGGEMPLNMPELHWYWGYPMVWVVMIATAITMLTYFYKRGWIFRG